MDAIDAPANVTVVERAPHREVLKHAAAVVTHAGHGTVIKSLAAGVPVVAVPLGRDQLDNAARVDHHGAGIRLKPTAKPDAIADAVRRVIEDPAYAASAGRMAAAIEAEIAEDRAVTELEALAAPAPRPAAAVA
jgi:UDP:flavonoid glycosyltransferase YjiC (YdhE family)